MKLSYRILITFVITSLFGCTSTVPTRTQIASNYIQRQHITVMRAYPPKKPEQINLYTEQQQPQTPYRVIGVASVSKYNLIGVKRADHQLQSMMKKLAASIGGDALINFKIDNDTIQAHVIAYQRILL